MLITKTIEIDAGHRVPNHKSKCKSPHGHRYKIEVGIEDKVIAIPGSSDEGMVIDFSDVKEILVEYIEKPFDHSFIIYEKDKFYPSLKILQIADGVNIQRVDFIPTAEKLAEHWYKCIEKPLRKKGIRPYYVKVWETPTSSAQYISL